MVIDDDNGSTDDSDFIIINAYQIFLVFLILIGVVRFVCSCHYVVN